MTTCCHEPGGRRGRVANLSIELTTRCNSACIHCFSRAHSAEEASLGLDLVKTITREGYDEGYRHLHLAGIDTVDSGQGRPLRPDRRTAGAG